MNNVVKIYREKISQSNEAEDEKISYKEAAELLGMSYFTARLKVLDPNNKITIYKYGPRNIKVSKQSLIEYIKRHTVAGINNNVIS